jgi:hypothetical protein
MSSANERMELEEFHRLQLADARNRYERERSQESKLAYLDNLRHFADLVMGGDQEIQSLEKGCSSQERETVPLPQTR